MIGSGTATCTAGVQSAGDHKRDGALCVPTPFIDVGFVAAACPSPGTLTHEVGGRACGGDASLPRFLGLAIHCEHGPEARHPVRDQHKVPVCPE